MSTGVLDCCCPRSPPLKKYQKGENLKNSDASWIRLGINSKGQTHRSQRLCTFHPFFQSVINYRGTKLERSDDPVDNLRKKKQLHSLEILLSKQMSKNRVYFKKPHLNFHWQLRLVFLLADQIELWLVDRIANEKRLKARVSSYIICWEWKWIHRNWNSIETSIR